MPGALRFSWNLWNLKLVEHIPEFRNWRRPGIPDLNLPYLLEPVWPGSYHEPQHYVRSFSLTACVRSSSRATRIPVWPGNASERGY